MGRKRGPPGKTQAHNMLNNAISEGILLPAKYCICQHCGISREIDPKVRMHYHHEDYTKPLEVIPLCAKCHQKHHRETDPHFDDNRGSKVGDLHPAQSESMRKVWKKMKAEGYTISEETRRKMGEAQRKRIYTDEERKARSVVGYQQSNETRRKISESVRKSWETRRQSKKGS